MRNLLFTILLVVVLAPSGGYARSKSKIGAVEASTGLSIPIGQVINSPKGQIKRLCG